MLLSFCCEDTQAALQILQGHLNHFKWKDCAFTTSHIRSLRWLIHATKNCENAELKAILTVTPEIQQDVLRLHIAEFARKVRKVRASARAKCRSTVEEFENLVSYVAMMHGVMAEAKRLHPKEDTIHKAMRTALEEKEYYDEMVTASNNKLANFKLSHLSIWHEIVDLHVQSKGLEDVAGQSVDELEELSKNARYQDSRSFVCVGHVPVRKPKL